MKTPPPEGFYRLSVKAIILDETGTKFLAAQSKNGKWTIPGGGLDWGESPEDGLRREIREEMSLEVEEIDMSPMYFDVGKRDDDMWAANVFFKVKLSHLNFVPSKECVAIKFVTGEEAKTMNFYKVLHTFINSFK